MEKFRQIVSSKRVVFTSLFVVLFIFMFSISIDLKAEQKPVKIISQYSNDICSYYNSQLYCAYVPDTRKLAEKKGFWRSAAAALGLETDETGSNASENDNGIQQESEGVNSSNFASSDNFANGGEFKDSGSFSSSGCARIASFRKIVHDSNGGWHYEYDYYCLSAADSAQTFDESKRFRRVADFDSGSTFSSSGNFSQGSPISTSGTFQSSGNFKTGTTSQSGNFASSNNFKSSNTFATSQNFK